MQEGAEVIPSMPQIRRILPQIENGMACRYLYDDAPNHAETRKTVDSHNTATRFF